MDKLRIKGELNQQEGRRKQKEADLTHDRLKCIEGKEEELVGEIQKEFSAGDDEILNAIEEADEDKE